ncbi:hypothetical protein LAG90_13215 [Marinilongibacter aquaticus]|uniref:hypothetical protein n=1 Tax=Marinilongibacter aquaticus TaxID=2975157 RepID=UPI0021BD17AB|nr:hypothetical protein [Marinilongibacter aquaticus]UBM57772.1 hypothetical protein LAG90_13215 [Marinilongibacter aquaticus]
MKKLIFVLAILCCACKNEWAPESTFEENEDVVFQSNCPNSFVGESLKRNSITIYIPDKSFEKKLERFDSDHAINGEILYSDGLEIDSLHLVGNGSPIGHGDYVTNVEGIQYFVNLKVLRLIFERTDLLDLRHNKDLEFLEFEAYIGGGGSSPQCKLLVIDGLEKLKEIRLVNTLMTSLNLRENPEVEKLDVEGNDFLKYIYITSPEMIKKTWKKPVGAKYVVCL